MRIIDFGFTHDVEKKMKHEEIRLGSPYYMAPEILKGEFDEKCDMWSLGVILYYTMSGIYVNILNTYKI